MLKLLQVLSVLSVLSGATAQSVSGCNSDLIEGLSNGRTASFASFFPRLYFAAVPPFIATGFGFDSAKLFTGLTENNKSYTNLLLCNAGVVTAKTPIEYTQETDTRVSGVGFPTANSTLDYFAVECTDGISLFYVCDPSQAKGSGTETFVMVTRTAEPVSTTAFEACKARAVEVYADVEFTTLTVGAC